jgi:predicted RNA-binding protein with PIN domain
MRIVIDGYNLLKALPECRPLEALDPERARDHLIALLGRYRWLKGHAVTVVFDGWLDGQPLPRRLNARGIQVIYSQRGEQADEVIRRMGPQVAHQGIAVSSDRALARYLGQLGVEVIGSSEFGARLRAALQDRRQEGTDGQQNDFPSPPQSNPKRTGRRASRAERWHQRRLRNL